MATDACLSAVQKLPPSLQHKIGALLGVAGEARAAEQEVGALAPTSSYVDTAPGCRELLACTCAPSGASEPAEEPLDLRGGVLVLDSFLAPADVLVRHRRLPGQARAAHPLLRELVQQRARALNRVYHCGFAGLVPGWSWRRESAPATVSPAYPAGCRC